MILKGLYQDALLASFTTTTPEIFTTAHSGKKSLINPKIYRMVLPQNYSLGLVLHTGKLTRPQKM